MDRCGFIHGGTLLLHFPQTWLILYVLSLYSNWDIKYVHSLSKRKLWNSHAYNVKLDLPLYLLQFKCSNFNLIKLCKCSTTKLLTNLENVDMEENIVHMSRSCSFHISHLFLWTQSSSNLSQFDCYIETNKNLKL